jgi:Uncharacterized phage-encoded protein
MMNEILDLGIKNKDGLLVVSSRIIANGLNKKHKHVLESIDNIIRFGLDESSTTPLFIESRYIHNQNGQEYREYLLTKQGFLLYMFNVQGYNDFKIRYINEFDRMENLLRNPFNNISEKELLAQALIVANHSIEEMNKRILENKPKVEYYDKVLDTENTLTITQIAKSFGMSGVRLNKILHDSGIQYKQSGQWMLYSKYIDMGLTKISTVVDSNGESHSHMKWTQKGKKFIYDTLLKLGFIKGDDK